MEAALGISVFPDSTLYDIAITKCMGRVPAYVYLTGQGGYPKTAPGSSLDARTKIFAYLQKQDRFPENDIAQEASCDFTHTKIWYFLYLAYCGDESNPGQWVVHRGYQHEPKLRASFPLRVRT